MRSDILGVAFDNLTMEEAVAAAMAQLETPSCRYVVTPNAEIVWAARSQPGLRRLLGDAMLVLPDGIGVIYASRILKRPIARRIPGIDFAAALMAAMEKAGKRLFLLGAKPGVAQEAARRLQAQYPSLSLCGTHDGYFQEDAAVASAIRDAQADVVFVCLGAPKQEQWMAAHLEDLGARLLVGLGGSLDVFAGTVRRAPRLWQRLGLEWLYRLIREPWRFGRMCRLPLFLLAAIGARIKGRDSDGG